MDVRSHCSAEYVSAGQIPVVVVRAILASHYWRGEGRGEEDRGKEGNGKRNRWMDC